ncbi:MAG: DUF4286 family protein [Muribaculaceae bacterium]|nr:DUF4286 family protein [Muribaculaceae bacterium]
MILFNTTFIYEPRLRGEFRDWLSSCWLARACDSGMSAPLCAMVDTGNREAESSAVQGRFSSQEAAERWRDDECQVLLGELFEKYGERILAFSTLMEVFEP